MRLPSEVAFTPRPLGAMSRCKENQNGELTDEFTQTTGLSAESTPSGTWAKEHGRIRMAARTAVTECSVSESGCSESSILEEVPLAILEPGEPQGNHLRSQGDEKQNRRHRMV